MSLYDEFFDSSKPCPESIKNCMQLRIEYQSEEKNLVDSGCKKCDLAKLRIKFLEKIWSAYMSSFISV